MAAQKITSFFPGGWELWVETANAGTPTHNSTRGSITIVAVNSTTTAVWINYNGTTGWAMMPQALTAWLLPSTAVALDIGTAAVTNLLRFVGTVGSEQIQYNGTLSFLLNSTGALLGGAITGVAGFLRTTADAQADAGIFIRKTFTAGATNVDFLFPARSAGLGWRIVDVYIRSAGATGGTVQLQTAAGAANVTEAMVPGNASILTRCTTITIANGTVLGSASMRLAGVGAGNPGGECWIRVEPA
jgi:hypothetical protein